ncbi:MAG: MXAN_5808 family serine peptidase [Deltaproteobacteria bacterium]
MSKIITLMKRIHIVFIILVPLVYFSFFSSGLDKVESLGRESLGVFPSVKQYVNRYYVDQSAVNPRVMLFSGLEKLERTLDEVLVEFPDGKDGSVLRVQVMREERVFDISRVFDLDDTEEVMEKVFQFIAPRLEPKNSKLLDVEYAVVDEMMKTLDAHSGIIPPEVYKEFMIETEGSFGGLGIVIGLRNNQLTVIAPIEGTPAYKSGIKPNDKIVQIGDESTVNMSLVEAVGKLRGARGTPVSIFVLRDGFAEPKQFSIIRDIIRIESVEAFNLSGGVGYVRIRDFQKNTLTSLQESIANIGKNENLRGIILDLRGNPGGLLDQAERVSDLFLKKGVIVTTKVGESKKRFSATEGSHEFSGRVVVLADSGSASASEIVAGALKNNGRATLIGETTFGKGSVQQIFELNDNSALKLTIAAYLTPGDISIQDTGITPDIMLHPAVISKDNVLFNAPSTQERENKPNGQKQQSTEKPVYSITYLESPAAEASSQEEQTPEEALSKEEKRKKLEADFYIKTARELILSSNSPSREATLTQSSAKIEQISKSEEQKIVERWKSLGIDWSEGGNGVSPRPSVSVSISPPTLRIKAGEKLTFFVEAENTGILPVYRLSAIAKSENALFNGREFIFGKLDPGQKGKWSATVEAPKWVLSREDEISLKFKDSSSAETPDFKFKIETQEIKRPVFAFNYEVVDDGRYGSMGNGNGVPEVGERIGLLLRVKNIGDGDSEKVVLALKNMSGDKIFLKNGRADFERLSAGEIKQTALTFDVKKFDSKILMELQILDEVFRDGITSKILIPEDSTEKGLVSRALGSRVLKDDAPIRGGSFSDAPVLALSSKGSIFKTLGEKEDWIKIILNENLNGWISKDDVETVDFTADGAQFREIFKDPPSVEVFSPPLSTTSGELNLKGLIKDKDGVELISVFVGDDKVKLLPSGAREVPISLKLKLKDGINLITLVAKDKAGLVSRESFVVRKEG